MLANLKNEITCSICKDIKTNPKLTTCLHSFCCQCLNELARKNTYGSVVQCPICQSEIKKPNGTNLFDSLPSDFHANRLLELYIVKEDNKCKKLCDSCNSEAVLDSLCLDCSSFLCEKCLSGHNTKAANNNHRARRLRDFKEDDFKELYKRAPLCKEHRAGQAMVEYYCHDCDRCMCYFCDLEDDEGHSPVSLSEAGEEKRVEILKAKKPVQDKIHAIRSGIAILDQRAREIDKKIALVKTQVHSKVEEIIASLRIHERELLENLENIRVAKHETLQSQKSELELVLIQAQSSCDFVESMTERDIPSEIISVRDHVLSRLSFLSRIQVEDVKAQESCCVGYLPNMVTSRKMKESAILGSIATSNTDPLSSSAEGAGLVEASVGEEAIFTVKARDLQNQLSYSIIDKLEVLVTTEEQQAVSCQISHNETGVYDINYIPKVVLLCFTSTP